MQKSEAIQFAQTVLPSHSSTGLLVTHHQIDTLALLAALSLLLPLMGFILGKSNSIVLCTCRGSRVDPMLEVISIAPVFSPFFAYKDELGYTMFH